MNPRIVRDKHDLLSMLRYQIEDQPHLTKQLEMMISKLESNTALADGFFKELTNSDFWQPESGGFFNHQALSTLPLIAIGQIEIQLPSLLRRVNTYGDSIKKVKVVVTPEDVVYAKASAGKCRVSLGLVNIVYCVCLYLMSLEDGMIQENGRFRLLTSKIPEYRAKFRQFLDLEIITKLADEFVTNNFTCNSYRPFVETNEILDKIGIKCSLVDACLTSGKSVDVFLANLLATMCVRFIVLHEMAHFHYGHNQLLEMWIHQPELAEELMINGFPSTEARRAMESFADVWATEMLIISEICSDSSILDESLLVSGRISPINRAKFALSAIEITFRVLGAVEAVSSKTDPWFTDLLSALKGEIDTMYPGPASRAAFAIANGTKNATTNHVYLRWRRWRSMKKDISSIDFKVLSSAISMLWFTCSLGGGMFDVKRDLYEYHPNRTNLRNSSLRKDDDRQTWHPWDRFDYVKTHQKLNRDLQLAKKWESSNR